VCAGGSGDHVSYTGSGGYFLETFGIQGARILELKRAPEHQSPKVDGRIEGKEPRTVGEQVTIR